MISFVFHLTIPCPDFLAAEKEYDNGGRNKQEENDLAPGTV
jgi:hypothetical protein